MRFDLSLRCFFLGLLVLVAACQAEKQEALQKSVRAYARALKNGDMTAASAFVMPEKRSQFLNAARELEGLTVAQVELQNISVAQDKKSAVSTYLVELYSMFGSEVSVVRRDFDWVYNDSAEVWTLRAESPLNSRK